MCWFVADAPRILPPTCGDNVDAVLPEQSYLSNLYWTSCSPIPVTRVPLNMKDIDEEDFPPGALVNIFLLMLSFHGGILGYDHSNRYSGLG
jgi:hypothetical protein